MDYTGYTEFPFPSALSAEDEQSKKFFLDLPDEEQLKLLNGCSTYAEFHDRLESYRKK